MKKIFLILALSVPCFGSKYEQKDPLLQDEIENIYKDISDVLKGDVRISSVTITTATITNLTVGTLTTSSVLGKIKQVISSSSTTNFTTTNSAYQATNCTATITPTSTSSRILVIASALINVQTQGNVATVSIARGGTNIGPAAGLQQLFGVTTGNIFVPCTIVLVDSPASVSALVYTVALKVGGGVTASFGTNSEQQTMTLVEIGP